MAGWWPRRKASNDFVEQFRTIAALGVEAAGELRKGFGGEPEQALARVVELEHRADAAVHDIHRLVDRTFITPYDKRDIVYLASQLDDVVDALRTTARHVVSYRALEMEGKEPLVELAVAFCDVIGKSATRLKEQVDAMPRFDHESVREAARAIAKFEDDGDELLAQSVRMLFPNPNEPMTAGRLAWREIYRMLEGTTDHCDHAMTVLVSIARQEGS